MNFYTTSLHKSIRLDRFISRELDFFTRDEWKFEIEDSRILVNNEAIKNPHRKINPGDVVTYLCRKREEPEIDANYEIIYEDEHVFAVNKTGNLPIHPSGIYFKNTLISLMQDRYGLKLYPIHRLDRETSGIILVGKTSEASRLYQQNLANASKEYNAIVFGKFPGNLSVDMPIGYAYDTSKIEDFSDKVKKKRAAFQSAPEKAFTEFISIESNEKYSLIKALPKTGRLHQIRVHLNYAGFPIIGDKLYGFDEKCYLEFLQTGITKSILSKVMMERCCLHARKLRIKNPFTNQDCCFEAPLLKDMENFIMENGFGDSI